MPPRYRIIRIGPLITALLLGMILIGSALLSYRSAQRLGETLIRGQGDALFAAFRSRAPFRRGFVDQALLDDVFTVGEPQGLRFIGLLALDGKIILGAGVPKGNLSPLGSAPKDGEIQLIDGRCRIFFPAPGPRDHRDDPRLPGDDPGPPPPEGLNEPPPFGLGHPGPPPDRHGPPQMFSNAGIPPLFMPFPNSEPRVIVVEYEPTGAQGLMADATRNLAIGLTTALALMSVALVLFRLAASAGAMEERLAHQRHLASLGEMSAVLAHEIRNPLAALKGHAQLLLEQLGENSREYKRAERVVKEAVRLEVLTNELLDFARSGKVQRVEISPSELVNDVVQALGEERFELDLKHAPPLFSLDPVRMRQVLSNLLGNALLASPSDKLVFVQMSLERGELWLSVQDRGPGIEVGQEVKIFEAFHTTRVHGTGLGLAVARRIVELHGGTISACNHSSGGALFQVKIPPGK